MNLSLGYNFGMLAAVLAGALVGVCIVKDAYLSLKEKPRTIMTLLTVVTLLNLAIGAMHWKSGRVVRDGVLTFGAANLICGLMVLVIMVVYAVNYLLVKREDGE